MGGRISQCLAAERRLQRCEPGRCKRPSIKLVKQIKKQAVRDCWIACFLHFKIKKFVREIGRN